MVIVFSTQHEMFMNPLAAYVYPKSSVLLDRYKPLGTILVSTSAAFTRALFDSTLAALVRFPIACVNYWRFSRPFHGHFKAKKGRLIIDFGSQFS